ncbi:MAG: hypothetical protein QOF09_4590 [Alphaproteobacteria bacterium]|nr:hypothetical protein [Alphaproteobacteria bacterium]
MCQTFTNIAPDNKISDTARNHTTRDGARGAQRMVVHSHLGYSTAKLYQIAHSDRVELPLISHPKGVISAPRQSGSIKSGWPHSLHLKLLFRWRATACQRFRLWRTL